MSLQLLSRADLPGVITGAIPGGVFDARAALKRALETGKPVDGGNQTYAISGDLDPTTMSRLANITLKQIAPGNNVKTLKLVGLSGFRLENVTVDMGSDFTVGSISFAAGIYAENCTDFEMVGCGGKNGRTNAVFLSGCSRWTLDRLTITNMRYVAAVAIADDATQGLYLNGCSKGTVGFLRVTLPGDNDNAGTPTARYTRGAILGGCSDITFIGHEIVGADQGIDVSSSVSNDNIQILSGKFVDCYTYGAKYANAWTGAKVADNTFIRCGKQGVHLLGASVGGQIARDAQVTDNKFVDTGNAYWFGLVPDAIADVSIEAGGADATYPRLVKIEGSQSTDRRGTPLRKYVARNNVAYQAGEPNTERNNEAFGLAAGGKVAVALHYPMCVLSYSGALAVAHSGAFAKVFIPWTTEISDTMNMHAANSTDVVIPLAGTWEIQARQQMSGSATNVRRLYVTHTPIATGVAVDVAIGSIQGAVDGVVTPVTYTADFAAGDILQFGGAQNSGVSLNLTLSFVSIRKVA